MTNDGGVINTCKSSEVTVLDPFGVKKLEPSCGRVSNAWVSYPKVRDNKVKKLLIPDAFTLGHLEVKKGNAFGWARVPLASW